MKDEYRNQALRILPHVCAKCGREFSGKNLQQLTVHHKDHNYKNNPPDGSNWELLCIYCHDNEHSRGLESRWQQGADPGSGREPAATHSPFAGLDRLLGTPNRDRDKDRAEE